MTDPERAAFVEWFILACDGNPDYPANQKVAELAAQAVEDAVLAERLKWMDRYEKDKANAEPIPWRAAMETAGVSGLSDQDSTTIGQRGCGPDPAADNPAQAAEPPQLSDDYKRGIMAAAYADCERIAREESKRWSLGFAVLADSIANAIAAKRKEVCGG